LQHRDKEKDNWIHRRDGGMQGQDKQISFLTKLCTFIKQDVMCNESTAVRMSGLDAEEDRQRIRLMTLES